MNEERIVKLLEQIRDLQTWHLEDYREAMKFQKETVAIQRKAVARARIVQLVAVVVVIGSIVMMAFGHSK
jgi:hypothetical protein